jgi:hypothetical protein
VRLLAIVLLLPVTAHAETLIADVDYSFVDQNGFGWARVNGKVTVTLTLGAKDGTLALKGKRAWVDGRVSSKPGGMDTSNKWEGEVDEKHAITDVVRSKGTITFKLAPAHQKLVGSCAPAKAPKLASTTLYECAITGFQWRTIAALPELHHPLLLESSAKAKARILNTLTGKAAAGRGARSVSVVKP